MCKFFGLGLCLWMSFWAFGWQNQEVLNLWENAPAEADWQEPAEMTISRARPILIHKELFDIATHMRTDLELWPEFLELDLFADAHALVRLEKVYESKTGALVLIGELDGSRLGSFHGVIHRDIVAMDISLPSGLYQVRTAGNGLHQVLQIDQTQFASDLEPGEVNFDFPVAPPEPPANLTRGANTVIDVMVVYTEAAKNQEGGLAAIEALIDLAVAETNTSYQNSQIQIEINLVHRAEVDYNETNNMRTDRDRLQNPNDGFLDDVHNLREQYGADMVALVRGSLGGACGIAYIMNPVTPDFRDYGFCIVSRTCATGYFSFGHELGHIMSARHDWLVDPTSNAPFPYNHAYVNTADRWRTIMGYNSNCSNQGFNCTRIIYWSNPEVTYNGADMGIPEGQPNPSFNAKALNNTATTVAAFMESTSCEDDGYEPNNAYAPNQIMSGSIAGTTYSDLQICPGDPDIFTVDIPAGHTLEIMVNFTHDQGNLDLSLHNEAGTMLDASTSSTDNEMLVVPAEASDQRYYVEIAGVSSASNTYSLTLKDEPSQDQIFEYWMSDQVTMCSNGRPTIINLLCYIDNGYECPPAVCQ